MEDDLDALLYGEDDGVGADVDNDEADQLLNEDGDAKANDETSAVRAS